MANVACLCGVTHSMRGTILKTLNQEASELQCPHDRQESSGRKEKDSQNSKKSERGAQAQHQHRKLTGFTDIQRTLGTCGLCSRLGQNAGSKLGMPLPQVRGSSASVKY